jgi:hypothetical protein
MKTLTTTLFAAAALSLSVAGVRAQTGSGGQPQNETTVAKGQKVPVPGQKVDPGTVGAMTGAVGNTATSAEDAKRQTQGRETTAVEGRTGNNTATNPGITQHSPGTVGASPGTTPPMGNTARK